MRVDNHDIQEFKRIYKSEFGEEITDDEAREMATRLFTLYELLARPLPSEINREGNS